jgi:hypothetical protein
MLNIALFSYFGGMKTRCLLFALMFLGVSSFAQQNIQGAWEARKGDTTFSLIVVDDYMALSMYNFDGKTFYRTLGGTIRSYDGEISGIMEFDSQERSNVGKEYRLPVRVKGDKMEMTRNGKMTWKRVDEGDKNLSGNWRITQREQNGKLTAIHTSGPRKTIKILSSTRFQWAAINTETGEFSGTGGGKYTFENGAYTEGIQFFSRDASRVGMLLTFNAKLEGRDWYHSGKSSKGDPINEVWSRGRK